MYSLGSLLPKISGIILAPIYTRFLVPQQMGYYTMAANLAAAVGVVMVLGQDGALTLFYRRSQSDGEDPRDILFTVAVFVGLLSTTILGLLLFLGPVYTPWLMRDEGFTFIPYVAIGLLMAWMTVPLSLQQAINRAKRQPGIHTAFQVAQFAINTGFTLYFVVALRQEALGSLKGTFLGTACVAPFAIFMLVREWRPKFTTAALRRSLRFGLPLVPHYFLGGFVLSFGDRVLIGNFLGGAALGLYGYAYNLSMAVNLLSQSLNRAWSPMYYELAGTEEGRRELPRLTTVYAATVAALALVFTMYMPDVLLILSDRKYWSAAPIMPIVVGGYFFFAMYMVVSTPVFYARKTRWIPVISGSAAVFNIGINFFMIPRFGIAGAAWSTFLAYLLMAAGARVLAGRFGGFFENGRLLAVVAVYLTGFVASLGIQALHLGLVYEIPLKAVALAALAGLFVAFGVVTPREIRSVVDRFRARRAKPPVAPITEEEAAALEEREAEDIGATSDATGFNPDDAR